MSDLLKTVMQNEGCSKQEAEEMIAEAREALYDYLEDDDYSSAFDVMQEYFGLEPDYLIDLL